MLRKMLSVILAVSFILISGCRDKSPNEADTPVVPPIHLQNQSISTENATEIFLSDSLITVDGVAISGDASGSVYSANDIIYYESGKDASYGEGKESDAHSAEEAEKHTVIHITKAGVYRIGGKLSNGQIFVDLGDDAKKDQGAVVTLVLDNVDITCTVAPAIFFYNVYECGSKDEATASGTVDTSAAGANVIIADGSTNNINGSYVSRIYKEGTTDKLHKYDAAFYSKRSINIYSEKEGTGILNIVAENEGLDSEMHLTVNGGNINIEAQNDGINTNEDNISVTTVNGGTLIINAGLGEEGDGIDSNGYLTINGGYIFSSASDHTPDGGIDADRAITVNGGTLIACGNMNGSVSANSAQNFIYLGMTKALSQGSPIELKDENEVYLSFNAPKDFTSIIISTPSLEEGKTYTLATENGDMTAMPTKMSSRFGGFGGFSGGMGQRSDNFGGFGSSIVTVPEGLDEWLNSTDIPSDIRSWIEAMRDLSKNDVIRDDRPSSIFPGGAKTK